MQREPNPYAQQRTYTVTETMVISVPSVVAEDVLDGEDGGMSAADKATIQELQSDMVELKSDVEALEGNTGLLYELRDDMARIDVSGMAILHGSVSELLYTKVPAVSDMATLAYQEANQKSQVTWLTTPDYRTSKLQITSDDGLKALKLTTNGRTANVYDLVVSAAGSSSSSTASNVHIIDENGDSLQKTLIAKAISTNSLPAMSMQLYDPATYTSQLYAIAAPWFASASNKYYGMRITSANSLSDMLELTKDGGSSWSKLPLSGPVYELGLLNRDYDSGSHMVPLVKTFSESGSNAFTPVAVKWSIGGSTQEANKLSGIYTLMANPMALFDASKTAIYDDDTKGAIRPVQASDGTLTWQKLNYSTQQWESISGEAVSGADKIEMTEVYDGVFKIKAEGYDYQEGKYVLKEVQALTSGIGAVDGRGSIVACLTADIASRLRSEGIGISTTGWASYYNTEFYGGIYDITELAARSEQLCAIASHLSQIRWLCENAAGIATLLNK